MNFNTETLYAILRLLAPLAVAILAAFGKQVSEDAVWAVLLLCATVASAIYFWWWKDNPITKAAQMGHELTKRLKAKRAEEVEHIKELQAEANEEELMQKEE